VVARAATLLADGARARSRTGARASAASGRHARARFKSRLPGVRRTAGRRDVSEDLWIEIGGAAVEMVVRGERGGAEEAAVGIDEKASCTREVLFQGLDRANDAL
jgi:hypothetical protein